MEGIKQEIQDKAEKELKNGYRELTLDKFKDKEDVLIKIYHPDVGIQEKLSIYYAKSYNELLRDSTSKVPTRKQMLAILREKEIWTDKDEESIKTLRDKLSKTELEAIRERGKKHPNTATIEKYRKQYEKIRTDIMEAMMTRESAMGQTIESLAERDNNLLRLVYCAKYADGDQIWENLDDLKRENNEPRVYDIMTEANYFWNGINQEVLDLLPDEIFSLGADLEKSQEVSDGKESTQ